MYVFFQIKSLQSLMSCMDVREFAVNLVYLFFMFSLVISSKLIIFVLFFLMLHLISSFLYARYMFSPYAYAFIELIDCILLSLLALNLIILISPVNTLYFLFLNLCCDFSINLLYFFYQFFMTFSETDRINFFSSWFFLCSR